MVLCDLVAGSGSRPYARKLSHVWFLNQTAIALRGLSIDYHTVCYKEMEMTFS